MPADELAGGLSAADAAARWRDFLRPDDVLVTFGAFHRGLAHDVGFAFPEGRIDLPLPESSCKQGTARRGGLEKVAHAFGIQDVDDRTRAHRRLAALVALVHAAARARIDSRGASCSNDAMNEASRSWRCGVIAESR